MPTATIPALSVLLSVSAALAGVCDPTTQFPDAATSLFFEDQIEILLGNGDGTFASVGTIPAGSFPLQIETTDFNADTHADLVFVNTGSETLGVLLGNGNGTF